MSTPEQSGPPEPGPQAQTVEQSVEHVIRSRLSDLLGGWYGSLETALPTVAFVVLWVWRSDVQFAVIGAVVATAILIGLRLARGGSLRYVLSSVIGIALAAFSRCVVATPKMRSCRAF
nr:DUF3159 domain-containing protein [Ornithinimicrobium sp. INDO-MA30-4]